MADPILEFQIQGAVQQAQRAVANLQGSVQNLQAAVEARPITLRDNFAQVVASFKQLQNELKGLAVEDRQIRVTVPIQEARRNIVAIAEQIDQLRGTAQTPLQLTVTTAELMSQLSRLRTFILSIKNQTNLGSLRLSSTEALRQVQLLQGVLRTTQREIVTAQAAVARAEPRAAPGSTIQERPTVLLQTAQLRQQTAQAAQVERAHVQALQEEARREAAAARAAAAAEREHAQGLLGLTRTIGNTTGDVEGLIRSFTRLAFSVGLTLAGFQAYNQLVRATAGGVRALFEATDQFQRQAIGVAGLLTSLQKAPITPESYRQNLDYARTSLQKLDLEAVRFLSTGKDLRLVFQGFAVQGIVPITNKDFEAIGRVSDAIRTLFPNLENQRTVQAQIRQLVEGQIPSYALLSRIIASQVGDLKQWVALHRQAGDLLPAIGEALKGFNSQTSSVQQLTSTWLNTLKTVGQILARGAFGGFYQDMVGSLRDITNLFIDAQTGALTPFAEEVRDTLKKGFDDLGISVKNFIQTLLDHREEILQFLRDMEKGAKLVVDVLDSLTKKIFDLTSTAHEILINLRIRVMGQEAAAQAFASLGRNLGLSVPKEIQDAFTVMQHYGGAFPLQFGAFALGAVSRGVFPPQGEERRQQFPEPTPFEQSGRTEGSRTGVPTPKGPVAGGFHGGDQTKATGGKSPAEQLREDFSAAVREEEIMAERFHYSAERQIADYKRIEAQFSQTAFQRKTLRLDLLQLEIKEGQLTEQILTRQQTAFDQGVAHSTRFIQSLREEGASFDEIVVAYDRVIKRAKDRQATLPEYSQAARQNAQLIQRLTDEEDQFKIQSAKKATDDIKRMRESLSRDIQKFDRSDTDLLKLAMQEQLQQYLKTYQEAKRFGQATAQDLVLIREWQAQQEYKIAQQSLDDQIKLLEIRRQLGFGPTSPLVTPTDMGDSNRFGGGNRRRPTQFQEGARAGTPQEQLSADLADRDAILAQLQAKLQLAIQSGNELEIGKAQLALDTQRRTFIQEDLANANALLTFEKERQTLGQATVQEVEATQLLVLQQLEAELQLAKTGQDRLRILTEILKLQDEIRRTDASQDLGKAFAYVTQQLKNETFDWVKAVQSAAQEMRGAMETEFLDVMQGKFKGLGDALEKIFLAPLQKQLASFLASGAMSWLSKTFGGVFGSAAGAGSSPTAALAALVAPLTTIGAGLQTVTNALLVLSQQLGVSLGAGGSFGPTAAAVGGTSLTDTFPIFIPGQPFQHGGIVTGPTVGLFEGKNTETVLPFDIRKANLGGNVNPSVAVSVGVTAMDAQSVAVALSKNPALIEGLVAQMFRRNGQLYRMVSAMARNPHG